MDSNTKRAISSVRSNLKYMEEDVATALMHAKSIKDSELTKKLEGLKTQTTEAKNYLASRLDPKQG